MTDLLVKLNYKGQNRIAVINAGEDFLNYISAALNNVIIDREIDPRFPYSYIVLFIKSKSEVDHYTPLALHNLTADGTLWYCYPKKTSKKFKSDIDRDHGWDALNNTPTAWVTTSAPIRCVRPMPCSAPKAVAILTMVPIPSL